MAAILLCYFYYDRLIGILFMGFLAADLKIGTLNFRIQTSDFKFQRSEVRTELLYFYIDIFVCQMEAHSEGPVNTLTCLYVG